MDVLDKLNSYAQGYRDEEINDEAVFAEVAAEVIGELRAIRQLLEGRDTRDGWSEALSVVEDRRGGERGDAELGLDGRDG